MVSKFASMINRWGVLGASYHQHITALRANRRAKFNLGGKVGSHAQTALTPEQRKSRAKTNRRNARFAFTELLRAGGYAGPNISRSKLIKQINAVAYLGKTKGRMVSRGPSVQNIPRTQGETRGSVPSVSAPVET